MYVRRTIKTVLWILAGILALIILAVTALRFHGVQRYIVQQALSSITEKTHTRIEVGSFNVGFTNSIVLHNIFVESRQRDTLLSIQTLAIDVNLLKLFSHEIKLTNVRIDSLTAHITRTLPDSSFNFDFIRNALKTGSPGAALHPDTLASPVWKLRLGGLALNGIHAVYDDEVSGLNIKLQLGVLKASMGAFDLDTKQFHINELSLTNTTAGVIQTKESPAGSSESAVVDFGIGTASLANLHLNYENTASGERYGVDLGSSTLVAENVDLPSHHIALKKFLLENTNIVIVQPKKKESKAKETDGTASPWVIGLDHLILSGNSVRYDVEGAVKAKGMDFNHLGFYGVAMRADNIYFSENRMTVNMSHTSFRERSGFTLRELSGSFVLDSLHAQLTDFTVKTDASRIHQNILLNYSSVASLKNLRGTVNVKASMDGSHLAASDILFFQPSLPIKNTAGASIKISSKISGLLENLRVDEFTLEAGDSTTIDLTGSVRGLPEIDTAHYDVNLRLFSSGRKDFQTFVADTVLPANIVLPASVRMNGDFNGTMKDFTTSIIMMTDIGNLKGHASLRTGKGDSAQVSRWKTDVTVEEFDVGSLLNDTATFGPVSLKASVDGTGLHKDNIEAQLNVQVDKAVFYGYPYSRLLLHGTARPNMFDGEAEIQDSSIAFTFNGTINTTEENPVYKFTLDLKGADLHQLNLTPDDIRVAGTLTSDLKGKDINDINGLIDVRNVVIVKNRRRYTIDSLMYTSVNKEGQSHINLESTLFAGQFDGTIAPGDLPEALKEHLAHYFTLQGGLHKRNFKAQAFTFHFVLRDPAALTDVFFPELRRLSAGSIEGNYNSDKKDLKINVDIPGIEYNNFKIDSLTVRVTSDADYLQAAVKVASIADSTFRATNVRFTGKAAHDSIDVALQSTRSDGFKKMFVAGVVRAAPEGYTLRLNTDGIVLQNLPWNVPSDNRLLFGKNGPLAYNVVLQGAGQSLSLQSVDENDRRSSRTPPGRLPLKIDFNDFNLATISQVVERDSGLVGGILNGKVVLQNLEKQTAFTSDLKIKDFSFDQRLIGDVSLRANNQTENVYEVHLDIAGNGNQAALQGKYRSEAGANTMDFTCDFTKVNLASIEPFTFGKVQRLSGTMTGRLHVTGTIKKPSVNGELNFDNTAFSPAFLDTYLHLNESKIIIDAEGVEFKSFVLLDTLGNTASLSGHVFTGDFRSYSYDFQVHTNKFLLLNKPAARDALFYGTIILDSDISVKGDKSRPIVTAQAELDKGTNLALVLPESELAVEGRRGVVRFVDVNASPNSIMLRRDFTTDRDTAEAKRSSIDLTSNISVNKDSKLRILIDPVAGDSLVIQGEATMSFTIDPSGKLTLTGRYEILGGSYRLSFGDFIKREFAIAKGSSLTWFGSPFEADVDITAIYTVKASALDLIQDQLSGISQEERNKYKQELPIQIYLMMKGKLLKPEIHFKLDLPPDQRGALNGTVYAKLNEVNSQESELNKQVFALLVLGRFIAENPLASVTGSGELSDFARSSVSQILSAQLNRLSEQYIAGASLNVGLESYQDYSSGNAEGRTQLQLALSKQLFDERVTVQVGGNVDIEGPRSQENSLNNFAGDLKVQYKLTEDGRWQLQVFRQNSYGGAIDGDITKTGAGVVFTIDYDKLFGLTLKPDADKEKK